MNDLLSLCKVANFEGHNIDDLLSVCYDKKTTNKRYAITITSRKKYIDLNTFRTDLYEFLNSIDYKFTINGVMEYQDKSNKVHIHGYTTGKPALKGNKTNPFNLKIENITFQDGWTNYCLKNTAQTLDINNENQFTPVITCF